MTMTAPERPNRTGFLFEPWFHLVLVAALGALVYANTLHAPFVFDDSLNIEQNPLVRSFKYYGSLEQVAEYTPLMMRYIGYLSFAVNYAVHGYDVAGYHLTNIAIHLLNALLVYWLVSLTMQTPYFVRRRTAGQGDGQAEGRLIALFSALLFVSHPVQTQAVTYIVQRFASLATLFSLLSITMYVKARLLQDRGAGPADRAAMANAFRPAFLALHLAAFASAVLAMKTKELSFTLPLAAAAYELLFFEGGIRKRFLSLLPLLLTLLIVPVSLLLTQGYLEDLAGIKDQSAAAGPLPWWVYLFTQFRVVVTYLRLLVLPVGQNLDHDYPVSDSFFDPAVLCSFLLLASLAAFGAVLVYRTRHAAGGEHHALRLAAFGILWFFLALSVESSVVPIRDVMFEHRVYLPSAGAFIAAVSLLFAGAQMLASRWHSARTWLIAMLSLAVLVLAGASHFRNQVWGDVVTLCEDIVRKSPNKARAHSNLGRAYHLQGRIALAVQHYSTALRLDPENKPAHYNLYLLYREKGWTREAMEHYERSGNTLYEH